MLAILQARTGSTRLPGKVLKDLAGAPMIARQIERLRRANSITRLVVATSEAAADDPLEHLGEQIGVPVFRGPLDDVLARFAGAVQRFGEGEPVMRLTADCPLADPWLIDALAALHVASNAAISTVQRDWCFPKGLDAEIMQPAALLAAHAEATDPYEREHVTPFLYRRPERFPAASLTRDPPLRFRWTVDTPDDFAFVAAVYRDLFAQNPAFTSADILAWQNAHPERVLPNDVP